MDEARMTDLGEGEILGDRFRVEGFLGKGGMGAVLAAVDMQSGKKVALKVMRSAFAGDDLLLERFRREAEILGKIDHPAVVGVKDAGALPDGNFFIALELLEGETLKRFMAREGRMPLPLLVPVIEGLCSALSAAHAQDVVHRDVKPSNVFLPSRPETSLSLEGAATLVKLVDFGVAKVAGGRKLTMTGGAVGTFQYMAPEQLRGEADVDGRADVYSVGVLAYEALAGVHPFKTEKVKKHMEVVEAMLAGDYPRLRTHRPELSIALEKVIAQAMHHNCQLRHQSADELARELREAARDFLARPTAPAPAMRVSASASSRPTMRAKPIEEQGEAPTESSVHLPVGRTSRPTTWIVVALIIAVAAVGMFLML